MNLKAVLAVVCSLGLAGYQYVATRAPSTPPSRTPGTGIDVNEARALARVLEPRPFELGAAPNTPVTPVDDLPKLKRPGTSIIVAPPAPKPKPSAVRPAAKAKTQPPPHPRATSVGPRRTPASKPASRQTSSPMTAALNRTFHSRPDFGLGTIKPRKAPGRAVRTVGR